MPDIVSNIIGTPAVIQAPHIGGGNAKGTYTIAFGGPPIAYLNRVSDSVAGKFVYWSTAEIDSTGAHYPGPGAFGVTTSGYTFVMLR